MEALKRLHKRMDKFDGVIIETTGLADPAPVVQTFFVDEGECIFVFLCRRLQNITSELSD